MLPALPFHYPALHCALACVLFLVVAGCAAGLPQTLPGPPASDTAAAASDDRRRAGAALQEARRMRDAGHLESATRTCLRGLERAPEHPGLNRLCAELLEAQGRNEEALPHRERTRALSPPPPPPPTKPLDVRSQDLVVTLLPPQLPRRGGTLDDWPDGRATEALVAHLARRLPRAEIYIASPDDPRTSQSVRASRRWLDERGARAALSIEVERARCGESIKDGRYALARLRVAAATGGDSNAFEQHSKDVQTNLGASSTCQEEALVRSLEGALAGSELRNVLDDRRGQPGWSPGDLRRLFPALARRIDEELAAGRRLYRVGQLAAAADHFHRALAIDEHDFEARALLDEVDRTLALSRELSRGQAETTPPGPDAPLDGDLDPRLSDAQLRALEEQLAQEHRTRSRLLAALETVDTDHAPPSDEAISAMRIAEPREGRGTELARGRTPGAVELRILYAPDGSPVARFYFEAPAEGTPPVGRALILREEDSRGDGRPDRWVGFEGGIRREVWEAGAPPDVPDVHRVYASSGETLERIELDDDRSGHPNRVFHFRDGRLRSESRDSNGDGLMDRIEQYDETGGLMVREEDRDHDGRVDVRTEYQHGRILRREILDPALADES